MTGKEYSYSQEDVNIALAESLWNNVEAEDVSVVREERIAYGEEKRQGEYTLEDYYALPDDCRVELIDGVIYDDPDKKKVIVYEFEKSAEAAIYGFEHKVPVGIFGGECQVDFGEIEKYISFFKCIIMRSREACDGKGFGSVCR